MRKRRTFAFPTRGAPVLHAVLLLSTVLALQACGAPKSYIVLLDSDQPGRVTVTNHKGSRTLTNAGEYVGLEEGAEVAPRSAPSAMVERDFAAALATEPEKPSRFVLYFYAGDIRLTGESESLIAQILAEVHARPVPEVVVVGHTDTMGTQGDNAALAARRAETVRDIVIDAGLDPALVSVSSHGENSPLVATADNVDEPRNRRVEVIIR